MKHWICHVYHKRVEEVILLKIRLPTRSTSKFIEAKRKLFPHFIGGETDEGFSKDIPTYVSMKSYYGMINHFESLS